MHKLFLPLLVLAVLLFTTAGMAESKIALSVGGDVLLPMGTFGDGYSAGFGGSVRGQYNINAMASVGLTIGYYTWSGKDIGGFTVPTFSGLPVRVFGKYYFMPEGEKVRLYGIAELGMFFGSTADRTVDNPLFGIIPNQPQTITQEGGSGSDFNYAPGVGVEFPLGGGSTKLDVSLRYDGIATEGSSSGSIGGRVGVIFPIGN